MAVSPVVDELRALPLLTGLDEGQLSELAAAHACSRRSAPLSNNPCSRVRPITPAPITPRVSPGATSDVDLAAVFMLGNDQSSTFLLLPPRLRQT